VPYKFGFNGKWNDNEVKGLGNQQDYGMRIYDARVGRFLSVDPLTKDYPWYTPYQFAGNSPIQAIDVDGAEPKSKVTGPPAVSYWEWSKNTDNNSPEAYKNGYYNYGRYYQQSMDDERIYKLIDGAFVRINQVGLFPNQIETFEYYNTESQNYEQFYPSGHLQPASIMADAYLQWADFGEKASYAVWNTTVFLTTAGIGGSAVFGTKVAGKFAASLVEDFITQGLTAGFDYKNFNLTSFGGNYLSAKFKYGYIAKNLISSFGEYKINGKFSITHDDFNTRNAFITAGIGIAIDKAMDVARTKPVLNRGAFTRSRNLSYKPEEAAKFKALDLNYSRRGSLFNLASPTGAGVGAGVSGTILGGQLPNENNKQQNQ
jgi:RHS repeat-associated protein